MNESDLVNHVLNMLQNLEGELFVKKVSLQGALKASEEEEIVDALISKDFERLWTWTTRFETSLDSLIAPSLKPQLAHFMGLATKMSRLGDAAKVGSSGFGSISFVLALCLNQYLQGFHAQLHRIQQIHAKRALSLIQLHALIEGHRAQFELVAAIGHGCLQPLPNIDYSSAVDDLYPDRERPGKAERAAQVFRVLGATMEAKMDDERAMKLVMWLFTSCLGQYLEKVNLWLLYGYLAPIDREEFCIISHSDDHVTSNIFWDSTYSATSAEVPVFLADSIQQILCTGKSSLLLKYLQQSNHRQTTKDANHRLLDASEQEPLFAKTRRLFAKHFSDTWFTFNPFSAQPPNPAIKYHSMRVESPSSTHLDRNDSNLSIPSSSHLEPSNTTASPSSSVQIVLAHAPIKDIETDRRLISVESKYPNDSERFFSIPSQDSENHVQSAWPSSRHVDKSLIGQRSVDKHGRASEMDLTFVSNFGVPISSVFSDCISEPIREHYTRINSELVNVLVTQVGVLEHLQIAQRFFFIEAPLSDLYALSVLPSLWNYTTINEVTLNHWLKQHLEASSGHYRSNFASICQRVSLHVLAKKSPSSNNKTASNELDEAEEMKIRSLRSAEDMHRIWINFEAEWPVSLFVTNRTHELYNSISSSMVSVMAAQYVLEQLTTVNKNSDPATTSSASAQLHKMQLFRAELLLFVRTVREYLVSRIMQVPWSEIEEEMRQATDLDQMRSIHLNYLTTIRERCLLSETFSAVKKTLDRIMSISIDFARQYQVLHTSMNPTAMSTHAAASSSTSLENQVFLAGVGVDSMSQERLFKLTEKLRAEFLRYHKLLVTFLSKVSSSASYVSDLLLRLNFSEFYQH